MPRSSRAAGTTLPAPQPFRNLVAQARLGVSRPSTSASSASMLADVDEPTAPFGLADVHRDGAAGASRRGGMLPDALNERLRAQAAGWG